MTTLWWVNAFVGPDAAGNATGVVLLDDDEWSPEQCVRVARALRAPDTVFVRRASHGYSVRFFSPYEGEMRFCGQGFIAADAVLRANRMVSPEAELMLHTPHEQVRTRRDADGQVSWFAVPKASVRMVESTASVRSLLPLCDPAPLECVVDSGRKRLFKEVLEIDAIALQPALVLDFCQRQGFHGVCFYARLDASRVRLRVFTVSLGGGEDASTGGAVVGLAALLPEFAGTLEVLQGAGHPLKRGRLLLRAAATDFEVGGQVELVAQGRLSAALTAAV